MKFLSDFEKTIGDLRKELEGFNLEVALLGDRSNVDVASLTLNTADAARTLRAMAVMLRADLLHEVDEKGRKMVRGADALGL